MATGNTKISFEEYLAARLTVATVEAHAWWEENRNGKPVERPLVESEWLDFGALQTRTTFGETKLREMIRKGTIPKGKEVEGKLMWHRPAVERAMSKLFKAAE